MRLSIRSRRTVRKLLYVAIPLASLAVLLICDSAYAAGAAPGPFNKLGTMLESIGTGMIQHVGLGATMLGGTWAVLAWMGKLGHFSAAISVFLGGIFLSQLESFVRFLYVTSGG